MSRCFIRIFIVIISIILLAGFSDPLWAASRSSAVNVTVLVIGAVGLNLSLSSYTFTPDLANPTTLTAPDITIRYYSSIKDWSFSNTNTSTAGAGSGWTVADGKLKHLADQSTGPAQARLEFTNRSVAASEILYTSSKKTGGSANNVNTWPTSRLSLSLIPDGTEASGTFVYTIVYTLSTP